MRKIKVKYGIRRLYIHLLWLPILLFVFLCWKLHQEINARSRASTSGLYHQWFFSTDRSMVVAMLQFFFVFSGFISGVCFVFMVLYLCFFWSLGKARDCGISWYIFFNP